MGKLATLRQRAIKIRDLKNQLSELVARNWAQHIDQNKFEFYKSLPGSIHNNGISGNEYQRAVFQVFECYQRKFERISFNASSFSCYTYQITHYKKATKLKNRGDIKSAGNVKYITNLVKVLNYLAKKNITSSDQLTNFINWFNQLPNPNSNLVNLVAQINHFVSKFTSTRIINLVQTRINRIVSREMANPVVFQSITYENFNQFKQGMVVPRNKKPGEDDNWNAYFLVAAIKFFPQIYTKI